MQATIEGASTCVGTVQVKGQLSTVESLDNTHNSFARLDYHDECEAAINEQIKYALLDFCNSMTCH